MLKEIKLLHFLNEIENLSDCIISFETLEKIFNKTVNTQGIDSRDILISITHYYFEIKIFKRMYSGFIKIHKTPTFKISTLAIAKNAKYSLS